MTRFRCIAADCEATCCRDWGVIVDRESYAALEKALATAPDLMAGFEEPPVKRLRVKDPRLNPEVHYAAFRMREDGHCVFFDQDRLCTIVRRFGDGLLGHDCATYPRRLHKVGRDRYELAGLCSCPEVVRLVLLSPDATELEEVTTDLLQPRHHYMHYTLDPELGENLYYRKALEITDTLLELMAVEGAPFRQRMGWALTLGERLDPYLSARGSGLSEERLGETLQQVLNLAADESGGASEAGCDPEERYRPADDLALEVIEKMMALEEPWNPLAGAESSLDVWQAHARSRDFWTRQHGARLEVFFIRFTRQAFFSNKFTQLPRLGFYLREWALRCALLRLWLFSSPGLQARQRRMEQGVDDGAASGALLDREAVRVFHAFSKVTQHALEFLHERREWGFHEEWIAALTSKQAQSLVEF